MSQILKFKQNFFKMSLLLFFKTSQNKTKFRNKQLSIFFFISEDTRIILSKMTNIDIVIIYNSAKTCLQIQYKMNYAEN